MASAQNQNTHKIYVFSLGNISCGTWITDRRQQAAAAEEFWVDGYISSTEDSLGAEVNKDVSINTDGNGIYVWIDNFCQVNPTIDLWSATKAFIAEDHPFLIIPNK